ncbi:MAG TPA: Pr6Pr family membrane protein [Microbacteriaceae bacterium]|nr:Pr6Pr family membrane protein [Microbacteriaceae bacterium]
MTREAAPWRSVALWYRLLLILVTVAGFITGERSMAYFTGQTNVIVVAYFAIAVYWMVSRRTTVPPAPRLRGAVVAWILTVGIIAHIELAHWANPFPGLVEPDAAVRLGNWTLFIAHYVVPAMVLIDWLAFGPHGIVRWRDIPVWLLYVFAYGLLTLLRAMWFPEVSSRFPYPFFEPGAWGWWGVLLYLLVLLAVSAAIAAAVVGLDRLAAITGRRRERASAPVGHGPA